MNFWRTEEWLEYLINSKRGEVYKDFSFYFNNKFIPLVQEGKEFYSPGFDEDKKLLKKVKELALDRLEQDDLKVLLISRYISYKTWEKISVDMHYDVEGKNVYKMHGKAIALLKLDTVLHH